MVLKKIIAIVSLLQASWVFAGCRAFFSPAIRPILLRMIAKEKKSIDLAMYAFTDQKVANALAAASARGVVVRCVLDKFSVATSHGQGNFLKNNGINVAVYNHCAKNSWPAKMHDKYIIFGNNRYGLFNGMIENSDRELMVTGSFNYTNSAAQKNYENAIVCDEKSVVAAYRKRFEYTRNFCKEKCGQHWRRWQHRR